MTGETTNQTTETLEAFSSVETLSHLLRRKAVSAEELTQFYLDRIGRYNGTIHAFSEVYHDLAIEQARASDRLRASLADVGPLLGVPIAVKENFDLAGRQTYAGSDALNDRFPVHSAAAVRRLESAGMIVLGRTHMVEFAYGGWGTNPVKGAPKNPWDLKEHRVAGGSSSGSAVAVAADLAPAALGTDTGGSVRIPAAWCGLVGLKTSKGLISQKGLVPLSPTLDTVGPMTRTIRDAALLLDCMSGDDLANQSAALVINLGLTEQIELGVSGLRLGVLAGADIDGLDPEIKTLFQDAAEQFRDMSATVEPIELPRSVDEYFGAAAEIMSIESYHNLARYVVEPGASVDPVIKARILRGSEISAPHYLAVLEFRKAAQQEVASRMDRLDALLVPGSHMLPVPLSQVDENSSPNRYGRFVNFLDMASLAVPLGLSSSRLPIGLQIVVRRFDDTLALRIGRAFEIARGGLFRAPAGF